eukprot:15611-Heterococcus_DN1.PRE.2
MMYTCANNATQWYDTSVTVRCVLLYDLYDAVEARCRRRDTKVRRANRADSSNHLLALHSIAVAQKATGCLLCTRPALQLRENCRYD